MNLDDIWAVVPTKSFWRGKSRLRRVLSDAQRVDLSRRMFQHVTRELIASECISRILVLTDGDEVERIAREEGHEVLRDDGPAPLGAVVDRGLSLLRERAASAAVVCMADLPRLSRQDVNHLVRALHHHEAVVVPDQERAGTNALGVHGPGELPTRFGHADSFARHLETAVHAGLRVTPLELTSIAFDVDEPHDLVSGLVAFSALALADTLP